MPKPPPDPTPGTRWRHYQGEVWEVICVAYLEWSRMVPLVIARSEKGQTLGWLLTEWRGKAHAVDGRSCKRFTEIGKQTDGQ